MNVGDVSGPRWVGAATNPTVDVTDYQKLVADARAHGSTGFMRTNGRASVPYGILYRLADAVEALRAENEKLRAQVKSAAEDAIREHAQTVADTLRGEFGKAIIDLTAENIVLRQQLDNMTRGQA